MEPAWYERGMPIYVCERTFSPAVTEQAFAEGGKALGPCLAARDVRHLASHLATDGTRCVCLFEAADAEAVREANRTAGLPFDKVWATNVYSSG